MNFDWSLISNQWRFVKNIFPLVLTLINRLFFAVSLELAFIETLLMSELTILLNFNQGLTLNVINQLLNN